MLKTAQTNIIIRAVKLQMDDGISPEAILESYPKLTKEDREVILSEIESLPY